MRCTIETPALLYLVENRPLLKDRYPVVMFVEAMPMNLLMLVYLEQKSLTRTHRKLQVDVQG
jgi:hypothetical protein